LPACEWCREIRDPVPPLRLPGQETRAAHAANRRGNERVSKYRPPLRQTVEVGRFHHAIAHEANRIPTEIISEDEKEIRTKRFRRRGSKQAWEAEQER
jgi:hypothetical protein